MTDCSRNCWIFAALMGVIVLILALGPGGAGIFGGLILAIVTALLLGGLLVMMFCGGARDRSDMTTLGLSEPQDARVSFAAPQAASGGGVDRDRARDRAPHGTHGAPAGASSDPRQAATFEPSAARRAGEQRAEEDAASSVIRTGAPQGASSDPAKAVTFAVQGSGVHDSVRSGDMPGRTAAHTAPGSRDRKPGESGTAAPSADQAQKVQAQHVSAKPAAGQAADAQPAGARPHHARAGGKVPASDRAADRNATASSSDAPTARIAAGEKKTAVGAAKAPEGKAPESVTGESKASTGRSATTSSATATPKPRQAVPGQPVETGQMAKASEAPAKRKSDPKELGGAPDDLGRIYGVGPKLTEWLQDNGIRRFAQIAAWSPEDVIAWGARLDRDGGRIERDDWVGQARILAAGGETEHSRRVDRGEST